MLLLIVAGPSVEILVHDHAKDYLPAFQVERKTANDCCFCRIYFFHRRRDIPKRFNFTADQFKHITNALRSKRGSDGDMMKILQGRERTANIIGIASCLPNGVK